jgi:DeoR/GlpR family transcriptional regulator of sugar metabolism
MSAPSPRHTLPAQRRQDILQAVRSGESHVADLAQSFGVSEMTVRRDLRALARDGKLERVRGGALEVTSERPFAEVAVERFDAKDRIGAAAAALVQDGQTVMMDIGTTTLQAARHLHGRDITVITTSLAIYDELLPDPAIDLLLPGGYVRRIYRSLVGVVAEDSLRQLRADVLMLGTSAVDAQLGVWDTTMVEVPIKRAMIGAAAHVMLLADAEKFAMNGLVRVCDGAAIDEVVTDRPPPAACEPALEAGGIGVRLA